MFLMFCEWASELLARLDQYKNACDLAYVKHYSNKTLWFASMHSTHQQQILNVKLMNKSDARFTSADLYH